MFNQVLVNASRIILAIIICLTINGCHQGYRGHGDSDQYLHHKVRFEGETLSAIAKWYTGSAKNWEFLSRADPTTPPGKLSLGDDVLIPQKLLVRSNPPTKMTFRHSIGRSAHPNATADLNQVDENTVAENDPTVSTENPEIAELSSEPGSPEQPTPSSTESVKPPGLGHPNLESDVFHELKLPN